VNASFSEVHVGAVNADEPELALQTSDVLRYVWHGKFGDMLVEVRAGEVFVNGAVVAPAVIEPAVIHPAVPA
jgi:hypothetical protein